MTLSQINLLQEKFQSVLPEPDASSNQWASDASARKMKSAPPEAIRTMSGETDVSRDWNRPAVKNGYKRLPMKPTDDAYTDEHVSPFYRPAVVDGDEGFCERNNMLDRE